MKKNKIERAIKKAKKETKEAEEAVDKAQEKVIEVAKISKGKKKKKLTGATRDLEKAVHAAADSCEATEEAEYKINQSAKYD
jgi:hypothetical protein